MGVSSSTNGSAEKAMAEAQVPGPELPLQSRGPRPPAWTLTRVSRGALGLLMGFVLGMAAGALTGAVLGALFALTFNGLDDVLHATAAVSVIGLVCGGLAGMVVGVLKGLGMKFPYTAVLVGALVGGVIGAFLGGSIGLAIIGSVGAIAGAVMTLASKAIAFLRARRLPGAPGPD